MTTTDGDDSLIFPSIYTCFRYDTFGAISMQLKSRDWDLVSVYGVIKYRDNKKGINGQNRIDEWDEIGCWRLKLCTRAYYSVTSI